MALPPRPRLRFASRFAVASVALFLGLVSASLRADAPAKLRLYLDWFPEAEHGGFYDALVRHLYADAGLDFDILPASPGATATAIILGGSGNLCLGTIDQALLARSHGVTFVAVMTTLQHDPKGILVHDESPVKDFPDLEGKAIAVVPGVSWLPYVVKKYQLHHVQEIRLTFGIGNFLHDPNYLQECFITSEPFFARQQGAKTRVLLVHQSGWDPYRAVLTSDRFLAEHRDLVQKFASISVEGWKHYLVAPQLADAEIKHRNPAMSQEQLDYSRQALIDGHFVDGFAAQGEAVGLISPARVAAVYKIQRELGVIDHDYDYAKSYDAGFVPAPVGATPTAAPAP